MLGAIFFRYYYCILIHFFCIKLICQIFLVSPVILRDSDETEEELCLFWLVICLCLFLLHCQNNAEPLKFTCNFSTVNPYCFEHMSSFLVLAISLPLLLLNPLFCHSLLVPVCLFLHVCQISSSSSFTNTYLTLSVLIFACQRNEKRGGRGSG